MSRRPDPGGSPRFRRIVAVGDLNGADDALVEILRGTKVIDREGRWSGGATEVIQLGDLFNRGGGARAALELLCRLKSPARAAGGRVTILLGNHEVMTALRNEAYCTVEEYLSFATKQELRAWPAAVEQAARRLVRDRGADGLVLPIGPRLDAWKALNAPGRHAMRRALGPMGRLGRAIRSMPIAYLTAGTVFTHAGVVPEWAEHGIEGLNALAGELWARRPHSLRGLPRRCVFRDPEGPLWDRSLATGGRDAARALTESLSALGARRMVIGHTPTQYAPRGRVGRVLVRHAGRLVLADVSLGAGPTAPRAALIIEGKVGFEWTPAGRRVLFDDR